MTSQDHAHRGALRLWCIVIALALFATACGSNDTAAPPTTTDPSSTTTAPKPTRPDTTPPTTGGPIEAPVDVPTYVDGNGFNDHSVPQLLSVAEYFAMARSGVTDHQVVKFIIPDLLGDEAVHWLDSNFYSLHDEWYWFRLINGQDIPATDAEPHDGESFATIADVYAWASGMDPADLPLNLQWVDSQTSGRRLYDPGIYEVALDADERNYGLGALIYVPANAATATDRWLIELEYGDDPTPDEVVRFFDRLAETLPAEIGDKLEWVVRSPHQSETADAMASVGHSYADRIVRFNELVPAGEVAVYNEGIAAGRLLYVDNVNTFLTDARDTDIILTDFVPDYLPPGSALITANPQTPLAHVNLLARNRGIPNASQSGVLEDPGIRQAARVRAYAIVQTTAAGELSVILISREEYRNWLDLQNPDPISVPEVDRAELGLMVDLTEIAQTITSDDDIARWRPIIGGKSAGYLTLLATPGVTAPRSPLAITVAPYLEHLDTVEEELLAMLSNDEFRSSSRARFLLLEGPEDFAKLYVHDDDLAWAEAFVAEHQPGTPLGDILDADGFKKFFRDVPMDTDTLAAITESLVNTYGDYAVTQGLRFRSSSSVEDIEGFNGAGLYDSNTGYLTPEELPDEDDHKRTVERAILKTWASYWAVEAYEERRRERIDHRSGAMGVLVHARFDDPLETNNGVATLTLLPPNAVQDDTAEVARAEVNVQVGAVSVTNPDPTDIELPEATTVTLSADGTLRIDRRANSTLAPDTAVMSDAELETLFTQLFDVSQRWRDQVNESLVASQEVGVVTLDFEFKTMAAGWPAVTDGDIAPARLVVKQVRSLDPGLRNVPDNVLSLAIPRDILARARIVERTVCTTPGGQSVPEITVLTDPLAAPDLGYANDPWVLRFEGVASPEGTCEKQAMYFTADQLLYQLLASGTVLNLSG